MTKILFVGASTIMRAGFVALMRDQEFLVEAVATFAECTRHPLPDLVVGELKDADKVDVFDFLLSKMPTVILSGSDNPTFIACAVARRAKDFVLLSSPWQQILDSIRCAAVQERPPAHSLLVPMETRLNQRRAVLTINAGTSALTPRETQVLLHLGMGLSNKDIGRSLRISTDTAKQHVARILTKGGWDDRTKAAVWAAQREKAAA